MPASRRKLIRCKPATPGSDRACSASSQAELEAFRLGILGLLAALDHLGRDVDAGHLLVDESQRRRCSHHADRWQDRCLCREPLRHCLRHEALEQILVEAHLQLEESRARFDLLQRALDPVLERWRARILDGADEELRRGVDRAARQIPAGGE